MASSLTHEIGIRALNKLLSGEWCRNPNAMNALTMSPEMAEQNRRTPNVRYFHKVIFHHPLPFRSSASDTHAMGGTGGLKSKELVDRSSGATATEAQEKHPVLYLCLCQSELVLVDPLARFRPFDLLPSTAEALLAKLGRKRSPEWTAETIQKSMMERHNPHIVLTVPYAAIKEVIADTLREDIFGLSLVEDPSLHLYKCEPALRFSCVFRKQLVENLQICHNIASMIIRNAAVTLPVRFMPLASSTHGLLAPGVTDRRLATFQYFNETRIADTELKDQQLFYRAEYIFLAPSAMVDRYDALPNRPCSTYAMKSDALKTASAATLLTVSAEDLEYRLVTKFLPPRNLSHMGSLTRARDAEAHTLALIGSPTSAGSPTGFDLDELGLELSQAGKSDLEFQFWVESIAQSIAMNESTAQTAALNAANAAASGNSTPIQPSADRFFIPEKGPFIKRYNVVNDKCAWTCYRVHIFTLRREIGVIGCRRKYLPPHMDTYQDMLFVLYGPYSLGAPKLTPEPGFMGILERVVNSLSPAVAPLPYREAEALRYAPDRVRQLPQISVHPSYVDRELIQARADCLLYTTDQYHWIATRDWLCDREDAEDDGRAKLGVVPRTKFIDVECYSLARTFCVSVYHKMGLPVNASSALGNDKNIKPIADPLAIIFRMMAELDQEQEDDAGDGDAAGGGYTQQEEWKCRVANYFAYCVDGGIYPNDLTLIKLANAQCAQPEAVDRILDFLLYMKQKPRVLNGPTANNRGAPAGYPFVSQPSIIHRIASTDILNSFTCNEDVLLKLLMSTYFETASERLGRPDVPARLFRAVLVTKLYNMRLVRAVCEKIVSRSFPSQDILVDPLVNLVKVGNFYVKAWAFKALAALAKYGCESAIFAKGGVGMAIWNVYTSRTSDLIEASLDLLLAVAHTNKLNVEPYVILTQPDLARKLIQLLAPFQQDLTERYHPRVLDRVATLIIQLAPDKEVRKVLINNGAHHHLALIVKYHQTYHTILPRITSALGQIYYHEGANMTKIRYSREELHWRDAISLVQALTEHNIRSKIQLCLNILIVLRMMLNIFAIPNANMSNRTYVTALMTRVRLVKQLQEFHSLGLVISRVERVAKEVRAYAKKMLNEIRVEPGYESIEATIKRKKLEAYANQAKIAEGVLNKIEWFNVLANYCRVRNFEASQFRVEDGRLVEPKM